jgi:hypothetical protein
MVHKTKPLGYAKIVTDLAEFGARTIDRTKQPHRFDFDIDVRNPTKPKKDWVYWGSVSTADEAVKRTKETDLSAMGKGTEARVVEAKTGKILKKWKVL